MKLGGNRLIGSVRGISKPPSAHMLGSLYEKSVLEAFQNRFTRNGLGSISIVGKSGDRGIDLIAKWKCIDLLVQCKATARRIPGDIWRDLGGVYSQRVSLVDSPTLIALASPVAMTQAGLEEFLASKHPYMHCILPQQMFLPKSAEELQRMKAPTVRSIVLNRAAQALLEKYEISIA